ncbi:hypothetical protein ANCCAN_10481 [Ancylostoma caninum]|uniref:Protein farnesyltransferase subunit beta n=1 Tax=Ancylostoma caninum TaxID=29170 RepID=A0A368GIK5_ANCCA|nr:hypothetical protein ANCCAN_10481 [Ancylostoma caninum]
MVFFFTIVGFLLAYFQGLDASRTWMCFWGLHSLNILGAVPSHQQKAEIIAFLKACQHPDGGYGGGPGQYAHLAPTYASVMALASLQMEEALESINLETLSRFLHRMKQQDGSFTMHDGGEADIRGTYCALSVAALCGIMTDTLRDGAAEWIIKCQTYEGGFGGEPSAEAHGGYAYCAVASLVILDRYRLADSEMLLQWLAKRQMRFEGGFQGRTNKLVDGCYSFWQAANFPLIEGEMAREVCVILTILYSAHKFCFLNMQLVGRLPAEGLFDARMLEEYILMCCQDEAGGFRDKPDKTRDLYHTCYVLSGLAIAQAYSALRESDGIFGGSLNAVGLGHSSPRVKSAKAGEHHQNSKIESHGKTKKSKGSTQKPLVKHREGQKWYDYQVNELVKNAANDTLGTSDLIALEQEADNLLHADIDLYNRYVRTQGGSEASWLQTVIKTGTASDRMTAMQLQMHSSPVHSLSYMEVMISSLERKNTREAMELLPILEEIFLNHFLPVNRKLVPFSGRPLKRIGELCSNSEDGRKRLLVLWRFEHKLKLTYERFLRAVEGLASLVVEDLSKLALRAALNLLAERPEGERFLLSMLVNKMGHPKAQIGSFVATLLEDLTKRQPNMRPVIVAEVERLIYRSNVSPKAHLYASTFLSQITLRPTDSALAVQLLSIYFGLFKTLVTQKLPDNRLIGILLSAANRALPFAKEKADALTEDVNTLYKIVHTSSYSVSLQTLKLLYQVHHISESLSDRFYTALYRKLLVEVPPSSYNQLLLLLFKVLKSDPSEHRVRSFVKRLLQEALCTTPALAAGILILISRLLETRKGLIVLEKHIDRVAIANAKFAGEGEDEEHYVDLGIDEKPVVAVKKEEVNSMFISFYLH